MTPNGIVEGVDIRTDGRFGLRASEEHRPPSHLRFQGFEKGLDDSIIAVISLDGHGDVKALTARLDLIIDGTLLAAAVRTANRRSAEH
jgi:hypothetical protein